MRAVRLKWPRCPKGYEIVEIRRSAIDWKPDDDWNVRPPADATDAERRLLAKWGIQLEPNPGEEDWEIARLIEPRNEKTRVADVFAMEPDLFVEFANINGSEGRLLSFVNRYGCLNDRFPPFVSSYLAAAARFQKVLRQFEADIHTGSPRWLSSFKRLRPKGFDGENDLNVEPQFDAEGLRIFLVPPDLETAIWLQFLMKAADNVRLTYCHSCRNFIAVAGSLGRSDKKFCSTACKQRDYRRREAEKCASHAKAVGAGRIANRRRSK